MRSRVLMQAHDFPPRRLLQEVAAEIDAAPRDKPAPRVLDRSELSSYPNALGPCSELRLSECRQSAFVMSQHHCSGKMYVTVTGKREYAGKGVKMKRSKQAWPRTRGTDRLRPVSLHRWICFALRGPPPSSMHEAAHVCGNDACVAGKHLRWLLKKENVKDQIFHRAVSPCEPCSVAEGRRQYSRLSWRA